MATTSVRARDSVSPIPFVDGPSIRWRQRVGAACLVLAPLALVGSIAAYAWATRRGGDDYTGEHALALVGQHPHLAVLATVCAMVGCLLVIPAVLTAMRLLRPGSPRLSLVAGSLMVLGYTCYFGIAMSNFTVLAMVERGGRLKDYAGVIDSATASAAATWPFLLFVAGNLLGTLLLAIAIIRSRAVTWWAGAALACWPVSHVLGLSLGSEWFELGGALLQLGAFVVLAAAVLRIPVRRWETGADI